MIHQLFSSRARRAILAVAISGILAGCGSAPMPQAAVVPVGQVVAKASVAPMPTLSPWLLHLPGIGGERSIDLEMVHGFERGGFNGDVEIYDWTENDPGLNALVADSRNRKESKLIAAKITERYDRDPTAPIFISCHSGGAGIAVWALEHCPVRVKVNTILMMSPALSPKYDLSAALRHVTGKVYVFSSTDDVLILSTGCKLMGTIDGVKTPAAGFGGFVRPDTGDVGQYAKVVSFPYNPGWVIYDDYGNHVGAMTWRFAQNVLAPLVLSGKLPPGVEAASSTDHTNSGMQ